MRELRLIAPLFFFFASVPSHAESLEERYFEVRKSGLKRVYSDYVVELKALRDRAATAGSPDSVFVIDDEIKAVEEILVRMESGDKINPIRKFDDTKDEALRAIRAVRNRTYDRMTGALEALTAQYIRLSDAEIESLLKQRKFDEARELKRFRDKLVAEKSNSAPIDLLQNRNDWVEVKGEWKIEGSKAMGEGDSELLYSGEALPETFTLKADVKVKSGIRPRIYLGEYHVGTWDPKKFILFPKQKTNVDEKFRFWDHNKTYRIRFVYAPRLIELYVDDDLIERHVEPTAPVKRLALSAGDYYSKGEVEFSNVFLEKGP